MAIALWTLLFAVFFTVVFSYVLFNRRDYQSMFGYFLMLFLASWALAIWVTPIGPLYFGVPLFSLFLGTFLIALLLGVFNDTRKLTRLSDKKVVEVPSATRPAPYSPGIYYWTVAVLLVAVILIAFAGVRVSDVAH